MQNVADELLQIQAVLVRQAIVLIQQDPYLLSDLIRRLTALQQLVTNFWQPFLLFEAEVCSQGFSSSYSNLPVSPAPLPIIHSS